MGITNFKEVNSSEFEQKSTSKLVFSFLPNVNAVTYSKD